MAGHVYICFHTFGNVAGLHVATETAIIHSPDATVEDVVAAANELLAVSPSDGLALVRLRDADYQSGRIEDALRREVDEELGIRIDVHSLVRVDAVPYVSEEPGPYRLDFYYRCAPADGFGALRADLASGELSSPSPEIMQVRLVPFTELADYDLFSADARFLHDDLPRLVPALFDGKRH